MATCARPGCGGSAEVMMLLHRAERVAELRGLDDPTAERYGAALCADHLARATAPAGWELVDRRGAARVDRPASRPRTHGAPGSATNPSRPEWQPQEARAPADLDELNTVASPLLRRAFLGSHDIDDARALVDAGIGPSPGADRSRRTGDDEMDGQLRLKV